MPMPFLQQAARKHGGACAEAQIRLLQRDHVGIELVQDGQNAFRIAPPVEADALMDIVTGERQAHVGVNPVGATSGMGLRYSTRRQPARLAWIGAAKKAFRRARQSLPMTAIPERHQAIASNGFRP